MKRAICLAAIFFAARAHAEQHVGEMSIRVVATGMRASECVDESTFVASVARMMHRDAATTTGRIDVEIHAESERIDGFVTMLEPGGAVMQRKLHGKECHDVTEGLALIVALAIDPLADPSLPAVPPPVVVAPPAARPTPPPPVTPPSPSPFYAGALVGARFGWGIQPIDTVELILGIEGGLRRGRWTPSVRVDGGPLTSTSVTAAGGTISFAGGEVNALACPAAFVFGVVSVAGCVSVGATIVATHSVGYTVPHDTTTAVGYSGLTFAMRFRIAGPLGVVAEGGVRFPFERFSWDVAGSVPVGMTAAAVGTAALALDFRTQ